MHVTHEKKRTRREKSRLHLCDDATNIARGGIKIIIKTHSHCQGRRSLNVVHIIIITSRTVEFVDCMCLCIAGRWNVHRGTSKTKNIFFLTIFKSNAIWIFHEREKKFLSVKAHNNSSCRSTIWRSRLNFFSFVSLKTFFKVSKLPVRVQRILFWPALESLKILKFLIFVGFGCVKVKRRQKIYH